MKILAIDTSGLQAGAAIVDKYITIGEIQLNARTGEKSWTHSEILMPAIHQMFKLTGLNPQNIDIIAYTAGPGSFTGLRIGASTAIGLAKGLNKPSIPVPTLDALAYNVCVAGVTVPMMDARRGQVYFAVYKGKNRLTDYDAKPVEEAMEIVKKHGANENAVFLGDGADAYKEIICNLMPNAVFAESNQNRQRAASVGLWALDYVEKNGINNLTDEVDILYVRSPQAVRQKQGLK